MSRSISNLAGLLLDLDGVLYVGEQPIKGAVETVRYLKNKNIPIRFTTNTTVRSVASLHDKMQRLGLPVERDEIFSAVRATAQYLHNVGKPSCFFLLTDDPMMDFAEFPVSDTQPDYIVIGDVGKYWDYELMNRVFHMVMNGAEMIALHKGKYWETENGLQVDMGAFIAGLEYVTGKEAMVIGKPEPSFFKLALDDLGAAAETVAMVGDDIDVDIGGAQAVGMTGILVKTGKYRDEVTRKSLIKPDLIIDSVMSLRDIL
ncbi:MAG: TIGR01458 family HAD-type hydrolase [Candidatus Zixiibacteriota bacterium]